MAIYVKLKERALQQANMDNSMLQIPIGAGDANWFEPLPEYIIIEFFGIMRAYNAEDEEI